VSFFALKYAIIHGRRKPMEEKKPTGRGGARPGSGPRRRRLCLDAETAKLLAEHMQQLNEPELTEEDVVKRLLLNAQAQKEIAQRDALQSVQHVVQEQWQSLLPSILDQLTEEIKQSN
jgi:hypothetical protein